jgi:hypothetical protein
LAATTAVVSTQVALAAPVRAATLHQTGLTDLSALNDLARATGQSDPWGPDSVSDLDEGTVLRPSRDVAKVKREQVASQTGARLQATPSLSGYRTTSGLGVFPLPVGYRPYDNMPISPVPTVASLAAGTTVTTADGVATFNHPVRQAQSSFYLSNSYRLTKNPLYLNAAKASAQKLIDNKVILDGAWYYPYDFDFAVHGDTTQTLKAPWYSGMAEGYALTAFVRLFELTGEAKWKEAADATFAALQRGTVPGDPFVSWVDSESNLWLEEYPRPEVSNSEKVLNGHIFGMYGLYDYWQLTKSPEALAMINGAITTVEQMAPTKFRRVNGASVYSLHHQMPTVTYHHVHVDQLVYLYQITHRTISVSTANLFRTDFPLRTVSGTAVLTPRSRLAYRLDANRKVIATRTVSFSRNTSAPSNRRERSLGGPVMLRISRGPYLDWWFPESMGTTWLLGAKEPHLYRPRQLTVTFAAAVHTGYRYDSAGRRVGSKALTFSRASNAPTGMSAIVEGRTNIYVSVGAFAGYWLPISSKLRFR